MARAVLGVDIGGTFTDFVLVNEAGIRVYKVPSTPDDPARAVLEGIRALGAPADVEVAHGSTVATNAFLERKGARTALVVTGGFEDVLEIGRQDRPSLYDFNVDKPPPLVPPDLCLGVAERLDSRGSPVLGLSAEEARRVARLAREERVGAVAVSLLFSFLNPDHERLLREALQDGGDGPFLSLSSELVPEYREYERTSTVVVNAYVGPVMERYLQRLEDALPGKLRIMQSSGGSLSAARASVEPVRTLLSGPAGGVVGALRLASQAGYPDIITFDMGGTSTDVSLCPGAVRETTGARLGGYPITVPMIDMHTVGAGGGSIAGIDAGGALAVGPESAGADPGPACYGTGDEPTVTDANLLLGRMDPSRFLDGRMDLDVDRAEFALGRLAQEMGAQVGSAADGVVRIANAVMERALRAISLERGYDPRRFTLVAFGGAGPMHACLLAERMRIPRVMIPRHPGVLSAVGVATADVMKDYSQTILLQGAAITAGRLGEAFRPLEAQARAELKDEGFKEGSLRVERYLDMRYAGQSYELMVPCPALRGDVARLAGNRFHRAHRQRFGYADSSYPVEVVTVRVKAVGVVEKPGTEPIVETPHSAAPARLDERPVVFEGKPRSTPAYDRALLRPGMFLEGPALVLQMDATALVPPGWSGRIDGYGNLVAEVTEA